MDEFAAIAETYDWTELSTQDIPFFVELARQAQGPILEIGAGTGRVTIPIARLGKPVTAFDVSQAMLFRAQAKWNAEADGGDVSFVCGDFRSLSFDRTFGLIISPGRTFEHALTDSQREEAFARCRAHLQDGGILALHVWGPPCDANPTPPEKIRMIDPTGEHGYLRFSWREDRDFEKELRRHYFRIEETDGRKRNWEHDPISLRWYAPKALDELAQAAGLKARDCFQDFQKRPYETGALQMIWIFQKK